MAGFLGMTEFFDWLERLGWKSGEKKYLFRGVSSVKYDPLEASSYRRLLKNEFDLPEQRRETRSLPCGAAYSRPGNLRGPFHKREMRFSDEGLLRLQRGNLMRIRSTLKTLTIIKKVSLSTLFATILLLTGCFITSCSQKPANNEIPIEIEVIQKEPSKEVSLPPPTTPRTVKEWLARHGYKIEIDSGGISIKGHHNTGEGIRLTREGDGNYRLTVSGIGTAILKSDAAGNLIIEE